MKRTKQFLCGITCNTDSEDENTPYQKICPSPNPSPMQKRTKPTAINCDLEETGTSIAVLYNVDDEEMVKIVRYVAMTEEVYSKFTKTREEHPLLKDLTSNDAQRPLEELQNIELQIFDTIRLDRAFTFIRDHIKGMGVEPVVAVEPSLTSETGFQIAVVGTVEEVDWITALFYTPDRMATLLLYADLRVADNS